MADIKKLAEELVNLTVKDVNELATILKDEYGIEPAAAPAAVAAGPAGGDNAAEHDHFGNGADGADLRRGVAAGSCGGADVHCGVATGRRGHGHGQPGLRPWPRVRRQERCVPLPKLDLRHVQRRALHEGSTDPDL